MYRRLEMNTADLIQINLLNYLYDIIQPGGIRCTSL